MRNIMYYKYDGSIDHEVALNTKTIKDINGMLSRFYMRNKEVIIGYADISKTDEYLRSWTWDHLDERTHQLIGDTSSKYDQTFITIQIDQIERIESILHSNPRWGGKLTNTFFIDSLDTEGDALMNNETKKMNEEWIKKQQEMKKTYTGYYIGGTIAAIAILLFIVWMLFFR